MVDNKAAFHSLLSDFDDKAREKVLKYISEVGLDPEDPVFMVVATLDAVRVSLEDWPETAKDFQSETLEKFAELLSSRSDYFQSIFQDFESRIDSLNQDTEDVLDKRSKVAVEVYRKELSQQARQVVKAAAFDKIKANLWDFSMTAMLAFGLVAASGVAGFFGGVWFKWPRLDPGGARQLTTDEVALLNWARSDEGRFAYNIMKWNSSLFEEVDGEMFCQRDARKMDISLVLGGREARSGFCALWVEPPGDRQYVNLEE